MSDGTPSNYEDGQLMKVASVLLLALPKVLEKIDLKALLRIMTKDSERVIRVLNEALTKIICEVVKVCRIKVNHKLSWPEMVVATGCELIGDGLAEFDVSSTAGEGEEEADIELLDFGCNFGHTRDIETALDQEGYQFPSPQRFATFSAQHPDEQRKHRILGAVVTDSNGIRVTLDLGGNGRSRSFGSDGYGKYGRDWGEGWLIAAVRKSGL